MENCKETRPILNSDCSRYWVKPIVHPWNSRVFNCGVSVCCWFGISKMSIPAMMIPAKDDEVSQAN